MSYQVQGNNIIDDNGNINAGIITATQYRGNVVTQLVAGNGISLEPPSGIGVVTVSSTGGNATLQLLDDISQFFDDGTTQFSLTIGGTPLNSTLETNNTLIAIGGVLQPPGGSYAVVAAGSTAIIQFVDPPSPGINFIGYVGIQP